MQQIFSFFSPDYILAHHRHKLLQDLNGGHASMGSSNNIGMLIDLIIRICWFLQFSTVSINTLRMPKACQSVIDSRPFSLRMLTGWQASERSIAAMYKQRNTYDMHSCLQWYACSQHMCYSKKAAHRALLFQTSLQHLVHVCALG